MRVTCQTVKEFIENLGTAESVFRRTVWCSTTKRAEDEDGVKFVMGFQASAVMVFDDGSDALLDVGVGCGMNYEDATQDFSGTELAEKLRVQVSDYVQSRDGWKCLPGIIDI